MANTILCRLTQINRLNIIDSGNSTDILSYISLVMKCREEFNGSNNEISLL